MSLADWKNRFKAFIDAQASSDASHGLAHIQRVVANAKRIMSSEGAEEAVVIPAAWLHDCVSVEKNSPLRAQASRLAAERAKSFLVDAGYPEEWIASIGHAIEAHSFSAGITPETLEAKVVQDADRLDALGAIGIARCFMVGERLGLPVYHPTDPFSQARTPDDRRYVLDHFYVKLLRLPETMQTEAGRKEAEQRAGFIKCFLDQLAREVSPKNMRA